MLEGFLDILGLTHTSDTGGFSWIKGSFFLGFLLGMVSQVRTHESWESQATSKAEGTNSRDVESSLSHAVQSKRLQYKDRCSIICTPRPMASLAAQVSRFGEIVRRPGVPIDF